jgi:hypothetical protein
VYYNISEQNTFIRLLSNACPEKCVLEVGYMIHIHLAANKTLEKCKQKPAAFSTLLMRVNNILLKIN